MVGSISFVELLNGLEQAERNYTKFTMLSTLYCFIVKGKLIAKVYPIDITEEEVNVARPKSKVLVENPDHGLWSSNPRLSSEVMVPILTQLQYSF